MKDSIIGICDNEVFLDKRVIVIMRDGRHLHGVFRSFDQFNNIVLENVAERVFFENMFSERSVGTYVIRGESIVLIGILKPGPASLKKVGWDFIQRKIGKRNHAVK